MLSSLIIWFNKPDRTSILFHNTVLLPIMSDLLTSYRFLGLKLICVSLIKCIWSARLRQLLCLILTIFSVSRSNSQLLFHSICAVYWHNNNAICNFPDDIEKRSLEALLKLYDKKSVENIKNRYEKNFKNVASVINSDPSESDAKVFALDIYKHGFSNLQL
ncbi:MAG: hypothetical protein MHMPM18_004574 [Marteilia pararefringens]